MLETLLKKVDVLHVSKSKIVIAKLPVQHRPTLT